MIGAFISEGISNWQIFQQQDGYARVSIRGSWNYDENISSIVYISVKKEDTGEPVIWWKPCDMKGKNWKVVLDIPVGGLYQVETCLVTTGSEWSEWAIRGDVIFHVGVGDLFVIAGQSNSSGYGKDYIYDPPEIGVHILKNNKSWDLAAHPLQDSTGCTDTPVNMDANNTGNSMYLAFAKYLKRELGYPIGLIQASRGGSELESWQPISGELYINMINQIKLAGNRVKGILWFQGCSDAVNSLCETYCDRFKKMKNAVCLDLNMPRIPFLVCQINKCYAGNVPENDYFWATVKEQQRQMGHLENVYIVPTTDSSLSDAFGHIAAKSNLVLGERLAKVALTHIYGKNFMCDAPDIICAKKVGDKSVLAEFAPVYDRLETFGCNPKDMAIMANDNKGMVTLEKYEVVNKNKLLLSFSRILGDDCVLHGAFEKASQKIIPVDFATHIPILSFYGVEIEKD